MHWPHVRLSGISVIPTQSQLEGDEHLPTLSSHNSTLPHLDIRATARPAVLKKLLNIAVCNCL